MNVVFDNLLGTVLKDRYRIEKFVDKVAYRIEEALQSNEIINVFQDDFDMLGDKNEAAASEQNANSTSERVY